MTNAHTLHNCARRGIRAFSLLEVLAAILLLSITSLGVARSTIISYKTMLREEHQAAALQLARLKLEELAAQSPITLNDANSSVETNVAFGAMKFNRTTVVLVNADNSRTITVNVMNTNPALGGHATLTDTFALWGTS